jgi:hypothetical protein
MRDGEIIKYIKDLVTEEQKLFSKGDLSDNEKNELQALQVELDQYWDLLRQRRALKEFGNDPDKAKLRGTDTIENYKQ